jgi:hypothetical protein
MFAHFAAFAACIRQEFEAKKGRQKSETRDATPMTGGIATSATLSIP